MKKQIQYVCDYCGTKYDEEKYCLLCEKDCAAIEIKDKDIPSRFQEIAIKHYIYDAKSSQDIDNCIYIKIHGFADDYEYEEYEYPCKVIIFEYLKPEPYEDDYETCLHIERLDDYIDRLKKI